MKSSFNKIFKGYLYGYMNEFHIYSILKNDLAPELTYQEFKFRQIIKYLGLKNNLLPMSFFRLIAYFEVAISLSIVLYQFFNVAIKLLFAKRVILENKNILLGLGTPSNNLFKMLKSIELDPKSLTIVRLPFSCINYTSIVSIPLVSGIKFSDLLISLKYSIKMIFFMNQKYGCRDLLFRSYSSFEYFLTYCYTRRTNLSNTYYYVNLNDRWIYLIGNILHKKYFIQHGIINDKIRMKKIAVDVAYYIDQNQKELCEKYMFSNQPIALYRKGMVFSGNEKLVNNGNQHILLVCNRLFFKKEEEIIQKLKNKNINLYIKPHPAEKDIRCYETLLLNYRFKILDKRDYPYVDVVISYDSTLATEYESSGIKVLKYGSDSFNEDLERLGIID